MIARRGSWVAGAALVALAVLVATAHAQVLARSLVSNAVGSASGGGVTVKGALGQPALGGSANSSNQTCAGFWCVPGFGVVAIEPLPPGTPGATLEFALGPAMPNPTRAVTRFDLTLPFAGRVRLEAFDAAGRRVGEPEEHALEAGRMRLVWGGTRVRAGVYFLRVSVDGAVRAERRVVVVP